MFGTSQIPISKELLLIGGGHSHVAVLKSFGMNPVPGLRVTLISPDTMAPYSGMLPGLISGHYTHEEAHIDLVRLSRFAGADFIRDTVTRIDPDEKIVFLSENRRFSYDLASINTGSTPSTETISGASSFALKIKPVKKFLDQWASFEKEWSSKLKAPKIAVIGAGAGGVELVLSLDYRLNRAGQSKDNRSKWNKAEFHIFQKGEKILPTHNKAVRSMLVESLRKRKIKYSLGCPVEAIDVDGLFISGEKKFFDLVILVSQATPPDWIGRSSLKTDDSGFLLLKDDLSSVSHPSIFGAGDSAIAFNFPRPKSGVFAVRQGKPLANNIRKKLAGKATAPFRPQKKFLSLISTGDKHAVVSRGPFALKGNWVWKWKDHIDRSFIRKYSEFPKMEAGVRDNSGKLFIDQDVKAELASHPMRCGGCGAKVGKKILTRVMESLKDHSSCVDHPVLSNADDSYVFSIPEGKELVQSVDFFPNFYNDPYVFAQIAANHALSDLYAMGADFHSALVNCVIPFQPQEKHEQLLRQLMEGVINVINQNEGVLAGGHTSEGPNLSIGLTVNGTIDKDTSFPKGPLQKNSVLILTKPLGTGMLLAADMRYLAKGNWIDEALMGMLLSNRDASRIIKKYNPAAVTDVTGFGLLGHLLEMFYHQTKEPGIDLHLYLGSLPKYSGVDNLIHQGISSSLQPENYRLRRALSNLNEVSNLKMMPLLFDPQTSGGLLVAIEEQHKEKCLMELRSNGYPDSRIIGHCCSGRDKIILNE